MRENRFPGVEHSVWSAPYRLLSRNLILFMFFSLWNYDLLTPRHNHISIRFQYIYRFHGSYNAVYGGQSGDAYICLTGGVSESIDLKELHSKPTELFRRVKNALKSGSLVSCSVPVREPVYVPLPVKTKILLHYISSASTSANILLF